jgi:transcriptional regulator with XRE-family HTH domain
MKSEFTVDGAKLTAARLEAGLSMEEVASKIGGNKSNLSRWERGIVHPSERAILKLVVLLKSGSFVRERDGGGNDGN